MQTYSLYFKLPDLPAGRQATKQMRCPVSKYSVNPWSAVEVATVPCRRSGLPFAGFRSRAGLHCLSGLR